MGSEMQCTARFGKQSSKGKALLETSELLFRGDFRLKIPFARMKSVKAADGELQIEFEDGGAITPAQKRGLRSAGKGTLTIAPSEGRHKPLLQQATFDLGPQAEKWVLKILHPKTRAEKLGIKAGANVSLIGKFEASFLTELNESGVFVKDGKVSPDAECIFVSAESAKDLSSKAKIAKSLRGATALWIVYPKGQKDITENDVIATGREAGLKDVKVVGFSATHTALKFVVPVSAR